MSGGDERVSPSSTERPRPTTGRLRRGDAAPASHTSRRTRILAALGVYFAVTAVLLVVTPGDRLGGHTPFNHFALLADAWLHGRLDLGSEPPEYTGFNDFAVFGGKVFVSFPPFPALVLLPFVALAGSAEATRDGLVFVLLAGVGPALLFLTLDKLTRVGRSSRSLVENVSLALLFAFGTVFFFTAVQGSVWFAAHVVGVACLVGFLHASIDADHPIAAGLLLGLAFASRTPMIFAGVFFAAELVRRWRTEPADRALPIAAKKAALFAAPLVGVLGILAWHNAARFGSPFEFGHKYLAIVWQARIERWGFFSFHYLGRNLAVLLTSMPWLGQKGASVVINAHGLALTVTSPFLIWAFGGRFAAREAARSTFIALGISALLVAIPDVTYQNSGWIQFGYRFSNDFAPLLVCMIAVGGRKLGPAFAALAGFAVMVNAFGAITFQRVGFEKYYRVERTQTVIFEPD